MQQQKFITSHWQRVRRAKERIPSLPEKISIIDREAYVEFFLLEDVARLYEYRLEQEKRKVVTTSAGQRAKLANIEKFTAVINLFNSAIEIAWGHITSGNYSAVWKAIPEHALMVAAGSVKNLPTLRKIAVDLLKELMDEAVVATGANIGFEEDQVQLDAHDANVRSVKGLPAPEEIAALIKAVEVAIPDKQKAPRTKIK